MNRQLIICVIGAVAGAASLTAQGPGKEYPDGHGGQVYFPLGDISFADEFVAAEGGEPSPSEKFMQAEALLGAPDFKAVSDPSYFTLGCKGSVTLRFTDNALVDIEGPDLYVFEVGPDIEPTQLEISEDGASWIGVGEISGGRASVDIAEPTETGAVFHYVRLRDLGRRCRGRWPGADIDAVGAIGAGRQISLSGSMLFDTGKYDLKAEAEQELRRIAQQIDGFGAATIVVEGHTDNVGSDADNQTLSERRAAAVADFLAANSSAEVDYQTRGYGESRPVATNETPEGQAQNRRVDLVVKPK